MPCLISVNISFGVAGKGVSRRSRARMQREPAGGRVANQILVREASLILEGGARRDILWLQLKVDSSSEA